MANELNNIPQKIPQGYYAIKNWRKFQHYKHRNPPWIKLHTNLLSSPDWVAASDATKLSMVCCMLVGSMYDGCIRNDPLWIKEVCHINWRVDFKPLIECGFLIEMQADASSMQADASKVLVRDRVETETEKKESIVVVATLPQTQEASGTSEKVRGTRLSEDWKPDNDGNASAVDRFGDDGAREELESFKDYWLSKPGKDGRKLDWNRTWRNWCRNSRRKKVSNSIDKNGFPASPGSPEFEAWRTYFRDSGQLGFVAELEKRRFEGRSFDFISQWPPS